MTQEEYPTSLQLKWADAVVLIVSDLGRSRDFYTTALGMDMGASTDHAAVFRTENGMLILLSHERADDLLGAENVDHGGTTLAGSYHVAEVESVDEAYETLQSRGVEFFREPADHPWGIRTAFFRDPDGHVWEISQDLPDE